LGIEPTKFTAQAAKGKGIDVIEEFFGTRLARKLVAKGKRADLLIGNNVLAHVPDIHDFVQGLKIILKETGVVTMEFPHLMQLVENNQFDTIYHEHFSYFSLFTVRKIFASHGLELFDVEALPTHGGSLRIYAAHTEDTTRDISENITGILMKESSVGMQDISYYTPFQNRADQIKCELVSFLIEQKKRGRKVVAYGAAAKGNTLLNYCGVKKDLIEFVADASPYKQGKFLPGSHVPVVSEELIRKTRPDFVLILPWNIKDEIMDQLEYIREWCGRFVIPIPQVNII
jgi:hypothetical protein